MYYLRNVFLRGLLLLAPFAVFAQQYDSLTAPRVWLRADGPVSTSGRWQDVSGNDLHADAAPGMAPTPGDLLNYNPTYRFDGLDDAMQIPYNIEPLTQLAIAAVFLTPDTLERGVWGLEGAVGRENYMSTQRAMGPDTTIAFYGNAGGRAALITSVQHWETAGAYSEGAYLALGSAGSQQEDILPFQGALAELLVFDRGLDFLQRTQVETYLVIKYGVPNMSGDLISSKGEVLWGFEGNEGFNRWITGIGRDDALGLYQKQSKSSADTLPTAIMHVGRLEETNAENGGLLGDGDFLVWGDNGGAMSLVETEENGASLEMLTRRWMVQAKGASIRDLPVNLKISLKGLPQDDLGYWLAVDRGGTGDFSIDNLDYISPDSIDSDSVAWFNALTWDPDHSGKDAFTLAKAKEFFLIISAKEEPHCDGPGWVDIQALGGEGPYKFTIKGPNDVSRRWEEEGPETSMGNLPAGVYELEGSSSDRARATRTFELVLIDGLTVDLGEDVEIVDGDVAVLDASTYINDTVSVSYSWAGSHGFTSEEKEVRIGTPGVYVATVTREYDGCEFTDDITITGPTVQEFNVYPTLIGADGSFNVSVSLEEAMPLTIGVYDLTGRLRLEMNGQSSTEHFFTGTLSDPGMYLVVLKAGEVTETRKLVVQ